MIAPGRYVVHVMIRYDSGGGYENFTPNVFADQMRQTVQEALGGNARMTDNLPFNPFVQTYKNAGWFTDNYYALITIFLSVERSLEETAIRNWISRAWGRSISGEHLEFNESVRGDLVRSLNQCSSDHIPTILGAIETAFNGCMSIIVDPGVDASTSSGQYWMASSSGYQSWQHTEASLLPSVPQAQPPAPVPHPAVPGTTPGTVPGPGGQGQPGTPGGTPGGIVPPSGGAAPSIWSEHGVKVALGAAVVAVVGVLIWSIASEPKLPLRPALAGRRTNRRRTR